MTITFINYHNYLNNIKLILVQGVEAGLRRGVRRVPQRGGGRMARHEEEIWKEEETLKFKGSTTSQQTYSHPGHVIYQAVTATICEVGGYEGPVHIFVLARNIILVFKIQGLDSV